jgi:hypothetical protein
MTRHAKQLGGVSGLSFLAGSMPVTPLGVALIFLIGVVAAVFVYMMEEA